MRPRLNRLKEIARLRLALERDGYPRLQMSLLVALTGGAGFLASYWLLNAGLVEMWMRYLVAFGAAYLVFLLLLWLWMRTSADDYADLTDLADLVTSPGSGGGFDPGFIGKGGTFDGGGASASFDDAAGGIAVTSDAEAITGSVGDAVGDAVGAVSDADEFAIPLALIVLAGAIVLSSFWIVYSAPALFAELLVDGVFSTTLYRKLRGLEPRSWLRTAVRRTIWPFLLTAALIAGAGWVMKHYAPEARSIGDVIHHMRSGK